MTVKDRCKDGSRDGNRSTSESEGENSNASKDIQTKSALLGTTPSTETISKTEEEFFYDAESPDGSSMMALGMQNGHSPSEESPFELESDVELASKEQQTIAQSIDQIQVPEGETLVESEVDFDDFVDAQNPHVSTNGISSAKNTTHPLPLQQQSDHPSSNGIMTNTNLEGLRAQLSNLVDAHDCEAILALIENYIPMTTSNFVHSNWTTIKDHLYRTESEEILYRRPNGHVTCPPYSSQELRQILGELQPKKI